MSLWGLHAPSRLRNDHQTMTDTIGDQDMPSQPSSVARKRRGNESVIETADINRKAKLLSGSSSTSLYSYSRPKLYIAKMENRGRDALIASYIATAIVPAGANHSGHVRADGETILSTHLPILALKIFFLHFDTPCTCVVVHGGRAPRTYNRVSSLERLFTSHVILESGPL